MSDQKKTVPGRAKGGKAAAALLSEDERKERGKKAAQARWAKRNQQPEVKVGVPLGLRMAVAKAREDVAEKPRFAPPVLPNGVVPEGQKSAVAMDYCPGVYDFMNSAWGGFDSNFEPFPGYPYLAGLATRAEYRNFADSLSSEITREWIKFKGASDSDPKNKVQAEQDKQRIKELEAACKTFNLQDIFKLAAAQDCFFGRGQISINIKGADPNLPLVLSPVTVRKGSLEGFKCIEAMWTTPSAYNSNDPTAVDFYQPREWFVLGKQVHASRLLTIITRPLPDMLKPAYNFSGMSLSQLAQPYVNNWLRTRQSVSDLINNFSITALKTNMAQTLQGSCDGSDVNARADLFTLTRSNKGLMLLDKDAEELVQVNTPLSGLHELQAQSLEQMCTVSRLPAVILTGVSPSGLNASSEGEIRVFYDWISSQQNAFFRHPLEICIKIIMLHLWGEIDETITFDFNPLWQESKTEKAATRKSNVDAVVTLIDRGVISTEEARENLANDPDSGFSGIDIEDVPAPEVDPLEEVLGDPVQQPSIVERVDEEAAS